MSKIQPPLLLAVFVGMLGLTSCIRDEQTREEAHVKSDFATCKAALLAHQTGPAMAFVPRNVYDYFDRLKSGGGNLPVPPAPPGATSSPGVDLLIRSALEKKVPTDLKPGLTLAALVQRIVDKNLLNVRDLEQIDLGRVSINGDHASAEIYNHGALTAWHLPFLKSGDTWQIDVMSVIPYAEVLLRVDRAMKGETETQQIERLVSKLPPL